MNVKPSPSSDTGTLQEFEMLAAPFWADQRAAEYHCQAQSHAALAGQFKAILSLVGVACRLQTVLSQHPGTAQPNLLRRLCWINVFLMGRGTFETTLRRGHYPQALALLRQELEALAHITANRAGKGLAASGAPSMHHIPRGLKHHYDILSSETHLSHPGKLIDHVSDEEIDESGTSVLTLRCTPVFDKQSTLTAHGLHVVIFACVLEEFVKDLRDFIPEGDHQRFETVFQSALKAITRDGIGSPLAPGEPNPTMAEKISRHKAQKSSLPKKSRQ